MLFPTKETPSGPAVVACHQNQRVCPTVRVDPDTGNVEIGTTWHNRTVEMTQGEFAALLAHGSAALAQADGLAGLPVVAGNDAPVATT